jgi:long-chain fatty acid transport protein
MPRTLRCLALCLAVAALPAALHASGFQLIEQNGSGLGYAFAGQAAGVRDASAVFFNPFSDRSSSRPSLPGMTLPVPPGSSGGNAGAWTPVPNGYFSWRVQSRTWLGLGVNVPFGLKTEWDGDWMGRFHAVKSEVRTLNLNPSLAVKVSDRFSLGAGVSYQRLDAELTQNLPYGGIAFGAAYSLGGMPAANGIMAQLGPAGLAREGDCVITGDDWSWGWNAGALLRVTDEASLAVSYRSSVEHRIDGEAAFNQAPSFATIGPLAALGAGLNSRFATGPVTATIELPDTFSAAAAYEADRVEVLADWTWTGWSSIQELAIERAGGGTLSTVPLRFQDTWRAGAGLGYWVRESWKLRLGVAYDKSPVQDQYRTPRLPDSDRVWAAAGIQKRIGARGALDLGYAHLFIEDAPSSLPNQSAAGAPPVGSLTGTYSSKVDIVSIQYRLSF